MFKLNPGILVWAMIAGAVVSSFAQAARPTRLSIDEYRMQVQTVLNAVTLTIQGVTIEGQDVEALCPQLDKLRDAMDYFRMTKDDLLLPTDLIRAIDRVEAYGREAHENACTVWSNDPFVFDRAIINDLKRVTVALREAERVLDQAYGRE
jgi:hypothetical protein